MLSFYIGGVAGALVIAVVVGLVASTFAGVLTAIVLIALVVVAGLVKRTATDYMVTNQRLYIRRGILSKREQQTRIDRVQNVNTEQRFRDRLLRVGTVDFDTAGTDDAEFRFVGISDPAEVVEGRRSRPARSYESAVSAAATANPSTVASPAGRRAFAAASGIIESISITSSAPAAKPLIAAWKSPLVASASA